MKTIKIEIEMEYDNELMHGDDPESIAWFRSIIEESDIIIHSNDIGDTIGISKKAKVVSSLS